MSDNIIILRKIMSDNIIFRYYFGVFCDIIAMSYNIIILIYNKHANIWQFAALMIFFIVPQACILN